MKAVEYINSLIKERDELKDLCKSHVETIRTMKKEFIKLNNEIVRKDKKIQKLERFAFYERAKKAYAVIASGEEAIYANIIIKKGVIK